MTESLADLERQARELARQMATIKAQIKDAEDNEIVVIPLRGADGEVHLHKVAAGAARILLDKALNEAKSTAQTESTEGAAAQAAPGKKGNRAVGAVKAVGRALLFKKVRR
jgi:hypothetical protein